MSQPIEKGAIEKAHYGSAVRVSQAYAFFDHRRDRTGPFDEGDEQNIHEWMRAVTEWVEQQEAGRG